ncbi:MAG: aspartate kinase [Nanoarchaeota archaeon]|nr:aspartate kinase [Nanoarchaeota archaeon]
MVTAAYLVQESIEKKPFLAEALSKGLINYAALADELKPEIESELKYEVKHAAIMMALRRLAEKLENKFKTNHFHLKESDMTIKSDLFEITILKSPNIPPAVRKLYDLVNYLQGDFLTVTHGLYELTIISNRKYTKNIEEIFKNETIVKKITKLSSLTIKIPVEATTIPGMFYIITKALAWENINIVEIISTLSELTFILQEDETSRAFTTLKRAMEKDD